MKTLLTLCAFLISPLAMASQISCFENSNSDYELHLYLNANGQLVQVSLDNADWGGAGVGEMQSVAQISPSHYQVTSAANSSIRVKQGAAIFLKLEDGKISNAKLQSNEQGPSNDGYHCL